MPLHDPNHGPRTDGRANSNRDLLLCPWSKGIWTQTEDPASVGLLGLTQRKMRIKLSSCLEAWTKMSFSGWFFTSTGVLELFSAVWFPEDIIIHLFIELKKNVILC